MKFSSCSSHGGYSWLERASKVMSGSVISNNVGSLLDCGISARAVISSWSACSVFVIAGYDEYFGEDSISASLGDS